MTNVHVAYHFSYGLWAILIFTSYWVYKDALRLGLENTVSDEDGRLGAIGWSFFVFWFWGVALPIYLFKRKRISVTSKPRFITGFFAFVFLVISILFAIGSTASVSHGTGSLRAEHPMKQLRSKLEPISPGRLDNQSVAKISLELRKSTLEIDGIYDLIEGSLSVVQARNLSRSEVAWIVRKRKLCGSYDTDLEMKDIAGLDCQLRMTKGRIDYLKKKYIGDN